MVMGIDVTHPSPTSVRVHSVLLEWWSVWMLPSVSDLQVSVFRRDVRK